jgi:hypothetical protein
MANGVQPLFVEQKKKKLSIFPLFPQQKKFNSIDAMPPKKCIKKIVIEKGSRETRTTPHYRVQL